MNLVEWLSIEGLKETLAPSLRHFWIGREVFWDFKPPLKHY